MSEGSGGRQGSPDCMLGALPAAADGGPAGWQGGEDNGVISLLDDSESEGLSDDDEDEDEEDDAEEWNEEDASEDESDAERPRTACGEHNRTPTAPNSPPAAASEEKPPLPQWEAFPSLAKTAGQDPPGRTSGLQKHKSCQDGIVVQIAVPASTGTVCPHTVGTFSCRQAAARARDVAHAWRVLHSIERATWETCQWAYPNADYKGDDALLAALRPLTHFPQLRAAVRQLFPPPLSLRQGRQRRDPGRRAWHVDADHTAVDKLVTEASLRRQIIRFKAEDFRLLSWQGSLERPPRLLLTLCEGAEPAVQQDASLLSAGSRECSSLEVEFGVLGRDGARMATASATRLLRRLLPRPGDVLRFKPLPAGPGNAGEGRLAAQLSVLRWQQGGEADAAAREGAAAAQTPVAADKSGGHAGSRRRKGRPARVEHGLRWGRAAADEAPAGTGSAEEGLVCANCGSTAMNQWRPLPGSKHKKLCSTCRAYCDSHGGQMRPSYLWTAWRAQGVKMEAGQGAEGEQQEPVAKRQRVEEPMASPAATQATSPVVATPVQRQQQQQQQQGPAGIVLPAAAAHVAPAAPAAQGIRREGLLPADASWERCHARLDVLLSDCGVDELDAQDFKFALLGMPEDVRRSHFTEVQARHAEGKAALACRWVSRVLGKQ